MRTISFRGRPTKQSVVFHEFWENLIYNVVVFRNCLFGDCIAHVEAAVVMAITTPQVSAELGLLLCRQLHLPCVILSGSKLRGKLPTSKPKIRLFYSCVIVDSICKVANRSGTEEVVG